MAALRGGKFIGKPARVEFPTNYHGDCAEVDPQAILRAMTAAVRRLGAAAKGVDVISLDTMSPSWMAMDCRGI